MGNSENRSSLFSYCSTVTGTGEPLVVEDTRQHELMRHSQALRDLGWVSYAAMPIVSRDGHVLGSFCVHQPHATIVVGAGHRTTAGSCGIGGY